MVQRPPFSKFISLVSTGDEVVLTLDEILLCEHSNKTFSTEYFHVVLLMCCFNTGSKFLSLWMESLDVISIQRTTVGHSCESNGYHELLF